MGSAVRRGDAARLRDIPLRRVGSSPRAVPGPAHVFEACRSPARVGLDLTSLLGPVTGVGEMVRQLAHRFPPDPELAMTGLAVTWRGRSRLVEVAPPGWATRGSRLPARPSHAAWRLLQRPRLGGFDLVHGPAYVVPPLRSGAALVTVHDLTAWKYPELVPAFCLHYPRHLDRALRAGAHVHVVSEFVRGEVVDDLGVDPDRVHVVPNGVSAPFGGHGDAKRGRRRIGSPYMLALGTVEPRKDHVALVAALAELQTDFPEVDLVIAGGEGWGSEQLDAAIASFGLGRRVHRLGYVDDATKADLLVGAELVAYPSRYEGFGLPVLEAMLAGVPVVSTTAGAITEVAGGAALLVDPGSVPELAKALAAVLGDELLRARLVAAGEKRAARYSWDVSAAEMGALYRQMLGFGPLPAVA